MTVIKHNQPAILHFPRESMDGTSWQIYLQYSRYYGIWWILYSKVLCWCQNRSVVVFANGSGYSLDRDLKLNTILHALDMSFRWGRVQCCNRKCVKSLSYCHIWICIPCIPDTARIVPICVYFPRKWTSVIFSDEPWTNFAETFSITNIIIHGVYVLCCMCSSSMS